MGNKCVIITGASRGIGAATARRCAENGYDVAINYNSSAGKAEETATVCREFGVRAEIYRADVSDFAACTEMVNAVKADFGGIYGLVNNAGITADNLLLKMTEEQFDSVIAANLKGAFNMMRLVSPIMLRAKIGRIVNLSSVAGIYGNAGQCNYSAAKAGIIAMTKSASKELGSRNITVNAVAPGAIETDMTAELPDTLRESMLKSISLKRLGKSSEIAAAICFLLSEDAGYITGQSLSIDGGLVL